MKKYSLGVLANETDTDGRRNKSIYVQKISGDTTASDTYRSSRNLQDPVQVESGIHAAASSLTTEEGRAVLYVDYSVITSEGYMRVSPYAAFVGKDGSVSSTKCIDLHVDHEKSGIAYDQDIDGGIFLQNDTNEYFAVAMLKNSHSNLTGDLTCSANIFIIGMNLSGDQVNIFDTGVIIEKDMKQGYSPVSVAVGDFMGSGTTDQIAYTTASSEGITMTVCQIKKDSGGNYSYETLREENVCTYTGRMKEGYIGGRPDYYPSAETVAGDFDGDGNKEIAVVYKDDSDEKSEYIFGQVCIKIFKWNKDSGSFTTATQQRAVNYTADEGYERFYINFLGLKAVRADVNGEGRDGIVILLLGHEHFHWYDASMTYQWHYTESIYPYFTYVFFEPGTINPIAPTGEYFDGQGVFRGPLKDHDSSKGYLFGKKESGSDFERVFIYFELHDVPQEGFKLHGDYPYVDRTFTLASGPFTGQLGTFKMIDDLAVSWSGRIDEDFYADKGHVLVFKSEHRASDGRFIGASRGHNEVLNITNASNKDKLAVVGADFLGEGVELESPVHLKTEGDRTYAAILQTPPYHVDNIPVPWGADPTTPALTNFTYNKDLKASYTHETSSETGQDVNFNMKGSAETIEAAETGDISVIKKVASFALEKAGAKDAGKVLDMLADKVESTKSEADKSSTKMVLSDYFETSTSDRVLYYSSNVHTWRYPIKEPAPSWLLANLIEGDPTSASGDKFLTFTMADDPVSHASAGLEDDCYQPLHEEGNLFSYPTNLAYIPGYQNRQLTLTDQSSITYSPGSYSRTIAITDSAASSTTEARKVNYGAISEIIGDVQVLAGVATENSMSGERGNSSTFTKSYSTKDTLTASFPNPETKGGDYANVTFTTDLQAYADEAGILTLGFAVSDFGNTASLWQKSVYNEKPDPALYLPYRYYFNGNDVYAREDEEVATKMRGVRFYIPDAFKYTGALLYTGGKYTIEIPIYNASFAAPDSPVEVALSFRTKDSDDKTLIGKQSVTIGGWEAGRESNKAVVSFDWTVPEDITEGTKELVAEIDPDNKLDEVHEGWNPEVPGGNNFGYFPFSVVSPVSLPFTDDLDSIEIAITINGMSMGDFIAYAAEQSDVFGAECVINNKAGRKLLAILELNMLGSENEKVESLTHNIGVMNGGGNYSYKFLANPAKWKECDELEAVFHTDIGVIRMNESKSDSPGGDSRRLPSSSGGGCDTGLSVLGLGIILAALIRKTHISG